jgi:hypothetical protein
VVGLRSSVAAAAKREQEQRNLILELKKDQQTREGKEQGCDRSCHLGNDGIN